MNDRSMIFQQEYNKKEIFQAITKLTILLALWLWMFWPEIANIVSRIINSSEVAHALVTPVAILLLIYLRRDALLKGSIQSSVWGVVFLAVSLVSYAGVIWPFNYGYARDSAMLPVLASLILVSCGWRILKLSLPMLLLVLLAIPIGSRIYARLIIGPETYTISAVATVLDQLPGVDIVTRGNDMFFSLISGSGAIGLGESNRGARLLLTFISVGVFVTFSRIRTPWRILWIALVGLPIVLFCNFLRLLVWGLIVIYTDISYTSSIMRNTAAVVSILVAYVLFAFVCAIKMNVFVEVEEDDNIG